jgi:peptide/nickel transport system ATP-binding protein
VVMYQGAVVEQGSVDKILKTPAHPYTKALLACRPILHQKGIRLPMVSDFITVQDETQEKMPPFSPVTQDSVAIGNNLLEVKDLNIWFPSKKNFLGTTLDYVKAVNGVSFEVKEGETLGLVGESGCGKTTLGRALLRLIEPTSGQILYKGRNLASWSAKELRPFRKEIQIIFQDPYSSLNPRLSVGNALSEVMLVHGIGSGDRDRKDIAVQWLEKVGLKSAHYSRYPHEFSGGQRQRIGIARALALHPGFVVCDESVSALDVSIQAQVLNLLNDLKREIGFTTVFISHDLGVVHYLSDRIMVMNQGEIEEIGQADDIFRNPTREYTRKLLDAIPGRIFSGF